MTRWNLIGYYINATAGTQITQSTPLNDNTGPVLSAVTTTGPTLNEWNSTLCIMTGAWAAQAAGWEWRPPQNGIIPFHDGITWSMPIATTISGNAIPTYTIAPGGIRSINSGVILCTAYFFRRILLPGWIRNLFRLQITTGQQLWVENITMDPFTEDVNTGAGTLVTEFGPYPAIRTVSISGYSMATGALLWTDSLAPFDPYDSIGGYMTILANGTLYLAGFGGDIWSINMLTGAINWYTNTTKLQGPSGTNSPYGVWPLWGFSSGAVADGVLFLQEGHEYSPPLFLGAQQLAINCTTGKLVWNIDAFDVDASRYCIWHHDNDKRI